jgi:hypothetical protein
LAEVPLEAGFCFKQECPRPESNQRTRFRKSLRRHTKHPLMALFPASVAAGRQQPFVAYIRGVPAASRAEGLALFAPLLSASPRTRRTTPLPTSMRRRPASSSSMVFSTLSRGMSSMRRGAGERARWCSTRGSSMRTSPRARRSGTRASRRTSSPPASPLPAFPITRSVSTARRAQSRARQGSTAFPLQAGGRLFEPVTAHIGQRRGDDRSGRGRLPRRPFVPGGQRVRGRVPRSQAVRRSRVPSSRVMTRRGTSGG